MQHVAELLRKDDIAMSVDRSGPLIVLTGCCAGDDAQDCGICRTVRGIAVSF